MRRTKDEADDGEQVYSTSEGDVLLSISGTGVFVSEGFPVALARKLRDRIGDAQAGGPMKTAEAGQGERGHDPGLLLVRVMGSAGVMKAALQSAESQAGERYTLVGR